jgi:hypothetical protein
MAYNTRDPAFCHEAREANRGLQPHLISPRCEEFALTEAASGQNAPGWTASNEAGGERLTIRYV